MTRPYAFLSPLFVLMALLAAPAAAQLTVSPPNRTVVVTAGKSATVKIDAGDCKPTWTAVSGDENVATVTPADSNASGKRSFKIKTSSQGSTTVSITLTNAGAGCAEVVQVDITVVVVMDATRVLKFWLKGDKNTGITGVKAHLKTLKQNLKAEEKAYSSFLKQTLKDLKAGAILVPTEGSSFGPTLWMADVASTMLEDSLGDSFDSIFGEYTMAVEGMSNDGYEALLLYGFGSFLAYSPKGFFEGSCEDWDKNTTKAWELFVSTVERLDALAKKADGMIMKLVPGFYTMAVGFEPGEFSTGGLEPTGGKGVFNADAAGGGKLKQKRPKATNYTDNMGDNNHGRIRAKGKADAGTVSVRFEKLDAAGNPVQNPNGQQLFEDAAVTVNSDCTWRTYAPGIGDTPNLEPGKWRVTVTQGGVDKTREITITM